MKRKLLLSVLAVVPAIFMPLAATSQLHPRSSGATPEKLSTSYKYEIFAGYGYTSLNQVNKSETDCRVSDLSVTRDWGKFFGLTADGGYYKYPYDACHPKALATLHWMSCCSGRCFIPASSEHVRWFFSRAAWREHIGGVNAIPKISFAGGTGGGLDYRLNPHLVLRPSGDDIASSFVQAAT